VSVGGVAAHCVGEMSRTSRGVCSCIAVVCAAFQGLESMAVPKEAASLVPAPLLSCSLLCGSLHFACLLTGPVQADG
jgi:hypothetical protein